MSTPETRRRSAGDPGALFPSPLVNRIRLLAVYLVTCLASDAGAESPLTTTLGFNDLGNSTGGSHMPDRYDGFRWQTTNWHYMSLPGTPGETFLALSRQFHGLQSAQIPSAPGILMQQDRVNLEFQGTPGEPYRIDASASPASGIWSQIGVATADDAGVIHFSDIAPTLSSRFYRCVSP